MAKKKIEENIVEKIYDYTLEEIMGDRFGRYAKSIIQDRALPDVRDGLKPVQRRILWSMYESKNTYDKPFRKSAKAVGDIMGHYHPHGDSSIYDALVRLSQRWKMREPLVEIHGNNGSIDGDGPAASRYTEARLSKIANVMLSDINKDAVKMTLNYSDEDLEPTVLPAHFPALLVNGSTGISAGYATNIPPHNLAEVIDATIKRIDSPNCRLDTILEIIKGPDFPTGGVVEGKDGLIQAYTTGKGKVVLKANYEIIEEKGKKQILIKEIPYEVLKEQLKKKIEDIKSDKKIDGIVDVIDESDRTNMARLVIELKKDADANLIINYLLKNTDLQINYNFNVVAIDNKRPKTLGLLEILDAFILHKEEVVINRSKFDLEHSKKRLHIVEGFIKALDILDEVIKTIRKSKNKADAIENLVKEYLFTTEQATAIVMMQLYKLTNTDVTDLQNEHANLLELIKYLTSVINDESVLKGVMKEELRSIKKEFATPRRTIIKDEITEIKIDELSMIPKEDFIVSVSKSGYIKKLSVKVYNANNETEYVLKEKDYLIGLYKINNIDTIILITNLGNYCYLPVRDITECKYKDIGKHISSYIPLSEGETIIASFGIKNFDSRTITLFSKDGLVKQTELSNLPVTRYSKPMTIFKLKDNDEVVSASINDGVVYIVTENGFALKFNKEEIPVVGLKTSGVKGIKLVSDSVVSAFVTNENHEYITIFTDKNTAKRVKLEEIDYSKRSLKGDNILHSPKSKKYKITECYAGNSKTNYGLIREETETIKSSDISIMDKSSTGSTISKKDLTDVFKEARLKVIDDALASTPEHEESSSVETPKKEEKTQELKEEPKEDKKQEEQVYETLTMSDFFDEFKI
ncbi:MAG TPA: DNA topoisomerase IV subunit A [Firmicutes bacterium]|jgi:topoisomerase-4 subunit A|nr:DNA topoisomerase IV subunit A [Bacillota bacterium]